MPGQISCPHCGQVYSVTDEQAAAYAGQTINCTRCQKPFTVPVGPGAGAQAPMPPMSPASGAPDYAPPQQSNGLATAALVTGIVACVLSCIPVIPGAIAIVLGALGLRRANDPRVGGRGFAIAGLVLGIVSLFMSTVAIAVLLPSLNRARATAQRVACAANLRQIGQGLLLYANENHGAYPPNLGLVLETQDLGAVVFVCPATDATPAPGSTPRQQADQLTNTQHNSYVYVGMNQKYTAGKGTVLVYEPLSNHADGANFLFADGHVDYLTKAAAQKEIAKVQAKPNKTLP